MTPESPHGPKPEEMGEKLTRREFLAGAAAMAAGAVPESAEAAMSQEEFYEFLMTIEGPEDLKNAVYNDYLKQPESIRYLMHRQFQKCHPDDTPVFVGYDGPGRIDVECRREER